MKQLTLISINSSRGMDVNSIAAWAISVKASSAKVLTYFTILRAVTDADAENRNTLNPCNI